MDSKRCIGKTIALGKPQCKKMVKNGNLCFYHITNTKEIDSTPMKNTSNITHFLTGNCHIDTIIILWCIETGHITTKDLLSIASVNKYAQSLIDCKEVWISMLKMYDPEINKYMVENVGLSWKHRCFYYITALKSTEKNSKNLELSQEVFYRNCNKLSLLGDYILQRGSRKVKSYNNHTLIYLFSNTKAENFDHYFSYVPNLTVLKEFIKFYKKDEKYFIIDYIVRKSDKPMLEFIVDWSLKMNVQLKLGYYDFGKKDSSFSEYLCEMLPSTKLDGIRVISQFPLKLIKKLKENNNIGPIKVRYLNSRIPDRKIKGLVKLFDGVMNDDGKYEYSDYNPT